MSSTLTVEPAFRKKTQLSYELKKALQKRFGGVISNRNMSFSDESYLEGLLDAGIEDAQIILDMIEKYEEITLDEQF